MDPAVGLVQAYLRVNGFFTVTEYPIVARTRGGTVTLTDVDVLAVRFPGDGRWVPKVHHGGATLPTDPKLVTDAEGMDMTFGEVKEGTAKFNRSAYSPAVAETAIRRFGCCAHDPRATARAVINGRTAARYGRGLLPAFAEAYILTGISVHEPIDGRDGGSRQPVQTMDRWR